MKEDPQRDKRDLSLIFRQVNTLTRLKIEQQNNKPTNNKPQGTKCKPQINIL